ncbi:MAG: glycosyltransferase [Deltaproteobacteria bacterium]|nr:glycosyltransferase [Deltaproteobacteria bacterium]
MHRTLDIVIPVYNEGENIGRTFEAIRAHIKTDHRITVVYDFEADNTLPVVRKLMKDGGWSGVALLKNKYGKGVLNAIKTGFEEVRGSVVLVMMADLSDDLVTVDAMFRKINGGYDIVCGSRYMKGGAQIGGPLLKKTLSRLAGVSLHHIAGIPTRDITNSYKMYTKKVLSDIRIESKGGFEIGMEIVVKAFLKGYRIGEVPSVWRDRTAGESRFLLKKWLPKYMRWYMLAVSGSLRKRLGLKGPGALSGR